MLQFKATNDQVKQIAINAIKASAPMGMGFLSFSPDDEFKLEDINIHEDTRNPGMFLDYVNGRMVKLSIWKRGEDLWETRDTPPTHDYQSWCRKYNTYEDLLTSVPGVTIV